MVEENEADESLEYSNHARDFAMPKIFNFDQLISANPDVVKETPYAFWGYKAREPGWKWLDSTDAWVKENPDDEMATKILSLRRPMRFYLCGCIRYCNSGGSNLDCHCITFASPPHMRTAEGYGELRKGEHIVRVMVHLNQLQGRISTQNWRLSCWNEMSPKLRAAWDIERKYQEKQKQQEWYDKHSTINDDGVKEVKVAARGRPTSEMVSNLSEEEQKKRKKFILRHAHYVSLVRKKQRDVTEDNAVQTARTVMGYTYHLNELFTEVESLGGAPDNWKYYSDVEEDEVTSEELAKKEEESVKKRMWAEANAYRDGSE